MFFEKLESLFFMPSSTGMDVDFCVFPVTAKRQKDIKYILYEAVDSQEEK